MPNEFTGDYLDGDGTFVPNSMFKKNSMLVGRNDGEPMVLDATGAEDGDGPVIENGVWTIGPTGGGEGGTSSLLFADVTPGPGVAVTTSGLQDFDGATGVDGQRVLIMSAANGPQRIASGLWVMHAGAWTRPTDYAAGSDASAVMVKVKTGNQFVGSIWVANTALGATVGTSQLRWRSDPLLDVGYSYPSYLQVIIGAGSVAGDDPMLNGGILSPGPAPTATGEVFTMGTTNLEWQVPGVGTVARFTDLTGSATEEFVPSVDWTPVAANIAGEFVELAPAGAGITLQPGTYTVTFNGFLNTDDAESATYVMFGNAGDGGFEFVANSYKTGGGLEFCSGSHTFVITSEALRTIAVGNDAGTGSFSDASVTVIRHIGPVS